MVSNRGRYVWSAEPFSITYTGDSFLIESSAGEVKAVSAGRTLREAYLVCCHKNFPPGGNAPSPELMTAPVYDPFLELGFEATETALCDYADQILKAGYPAGTLVVPAGWQSSIGSNEPCMLGSLLPIDDCHPAATNRASTFSAILPAWCAHCMTRGSG